MCYPSLKNNNSTWPPDSGGLILASDTMQTLSLCLQIFCLRMTILADSFGPQIWPDKMFNVFIHNKGADKTVHCDFVVSCKSGYIHLQTCGKDIISSFLLFSNSQPPSGAITLN